MIGIGNDIYDNFRDVINEDIECLDPKEIETRRKVAECENTIESEKQQRNDWDASVKGKRLESLKGMIYRRRKVLTDLGYCKAKSKQVAAVSSDDVDELLKEYDDFVAGDASEGLDPDFEDDEEEEAKASLEGSAVASVEATGVDCSVVNARLRSKIKDYEAVIAKCEEEMKPLVAERAVFEKRVDKCKNMLKNMKEKLTKFRQTRKKSDDGIESKMLDVLKTVGVELTRYHGGSLNGVDIKKVIGNAAYIFDEFAVILKENKKADSPMSNAAIDKLCADTKQLFLLWDGAFALARKVNPTEEDCELYRQYVEAAVDCHVRMGCSITHKVHLMLVHVYWQMKTVPRGLGEKMEDWVELMHQSGSRRRRRFRTMKDLLRRAMATARSEQRGKNADILAQMVRVAEKYERKSSSADDKKTAAEKRMEERQRLRAEALSAYCEQKKQARAAAAEIIAAFVLKKRVPPSCD